MSAFTFHRGGFDFQSRGRHMTYEHNVVFVTPNMPRSVVDYYNCVEKTATKPFAKHLDYGGSFELVTVARRKSDIRGPVYFSGD